MRTRERVPSTGRERSREGEPKRWVSPRKKLKTNYISSEGSEDSDIVEEDEENSEEMLSRWPQWDVTCGTKKGILHVENLESGQEDCIESEGRWFSPSGFEQFGGKGSHKKWKNTITYKNQPLNFWIDHRYLNPLPNRRRTFRASEPSEHKKSHPEESEDKNNHKEEVGPDEQPAETSEDHTDGQNEEQKNDTIDIASRVSQRKPLLILHRLDPLQGDFHLLLNDVVLLQNGSGSMSTETQSNEKVDTNEDEETQSKENVNTNEDKEMRSKEKVDTNEDEEMQSNENVDTNEDEEMQSNENVDTNEDEEMQNNENVDTNEDEEMQSKEKADTNEDENPEPVETSEPQGETLLYCSDTENEEQVEVEHMPIEDTVIFQDQGVGTISLEEIIIENIKISQIDLESVKVDATPPNVIIEESAQIIERPPQEENPSTVLDEPSATAQTSSEVDFMDLEQLKKEKIKWQIKVLKLQEEYYSLQIQKLKQ
ncbi:hypothetical protein NL108_009097 [Boleophthalmus pectinirostris]|uniref:trichohyalin-like n=1 Tax=Boleophthalmus pectinirostris TaxID=150288 RepID=UPI00243106F4|nr:trichohyalin-like [Boleophthalmus pectinirostris]KAJ0058209.1 hypothetical protein NL108_009097 [Boleophthalmus pectinirostris]